MSLGKQKILAQGASASVGQTDYFNPYTFDGNDSTQVINDIGFAPDFVWLKRRDSDTVGGTNHFVFDILRGATQRLFTNTGTASAADSDSLTAFSSTGFTLGDDVSCNGGDMVAWCLKAGGAQTSLNTSGDLDAYVSANPSKGFSIVHHEKQNANNQTIPHGLGVSPKLVIHKCTSASSAWGVFAPSLLGSRYLYLSSDSNGASSSHYTWTYNSSFITTPNLTYGYYFGSLFSGTINNMLYCFADVAGVQKIGVYNGGTSGYEVTFDFTPRFVMIKNATNVGGWVIVDSQRGSNELYPHLTNAEDTSTTNVVLGTNKFTLNTTGSWYNASGSTYIYLAIA
jgi:hypothetical protein